MRSPHVVLVLVAAGCGFNPHQNYADPVDAGSDLSAAPDVPSNDIQFHPDLGPDVVTKDATKDLGQDAVTSDAGRDVAEVGKDIVGPDAVPVTDTKVGPDSAPEADSQCPPSKPHLIGSVCKECENDSECRALYADKPLCSFGTCEALVTTPDAGPDMLSDLLSTPDVPGADAAPDFGPDSFVQTDLPPACTGCPDQYHAVYFRCIDGVPYDCMGQVNLHDGICPLTGPNMNSSGCSHCSPDQGLNCPPTAPYCKTSTGECLTTPI